MAEALHKKKPEHTDDWVARALESAHREAEARKKYRESHPDKVRREEYLEARDVYLSQINMQEDQLLSSADRQAHKKALDNLKVILDHYDKTSGKPMPEKDDIYTRLRAIVATYHSRHMEEITSNPDVRKAVVYLEKRLNA